MNLDPIQLEQYVSEDLHRWVAKQFPREEEAIDTLEMMLAFLATCSSDELAYWISAGWWKLYNQAKRHFLRG